MIKTLKTISAAATLCGFASMNAQVGINNSTPKATVDITARTPVGVSNPNLKDGILIPNVDRARAQAMGNNSSPAVPESTMIYVNNITTGTATGSAANISAPGYYYFDPAALPSPGIWQALRPTNVDLYGFQVKIPPHNQYAADFSNHSVSTYDNDNWWVISKTSVNTTGGQPARMTIIYEYQGSALNITNLYPQLTAGNNSSYPDVYTANIISIANTGAGKTRLTVSVVRAESLSNWQGIFYLNALFARKIN